VLPFQAWWLCSKRGHDLTWAPLGARACRRSTIGRSREQTKKSPSLGKRCLTEKPPVSTGTRLFCLFSLPPSTSSIEWIRKMLCGIIYYVLHQPISFFSLLPLHRCFFCSRLELQNCSAIAAIAALNSAPLWNFFLCFLLVLSLIAYSYRSLLSLAIICMHEPARTASVSCGCAVYSGSHLAIRAQSRSAADWCYMFP